MFLRRSLTFRQIIWTKQCQPHTFYRLNSTKAELLQKYKDKLEAKAKILGYQSVEDLNESLKDDIEARKKQLNAIDPLKDLEGFEAEQASKMKKNILDHQIKIRDPIKRDAPIAPYKTLDSFVDSAKLKDLNKQEIEYIWRARFQKDDRSMVAILGATQFSNMYALGFKNRTFILPLAKESGGYEMHFVQWSFVGPETTHCMLTTLAEYKLHNEYAKPHSTIMFHQELAHEKDVVLMNCHVEKESNVSLADAQFLILNIQRFYGAMKSISKAKLELLEAFNRGEEMFDMEKLIEEATSFE
ncbi:hypothetical protein PSN45_000230 [Yamadazyma tenuis]|uniref:ATP11-domain-containing protein n=1 Tax=Candida tenuis (strain ATCC 10573 / BCRC 21748 / CBS 615 / JCM 9827 / NBRC 10315 / NRRL Y-1498 / VKM Y-70) TaxID=590646 RepID=G3BBJ3_CANTC|nr:ATP11-domain-containing protein [Yamadazyma tenuis ATCC 10573]XP_006688729.1 uncharacterized protein CANTEDRAFT_115019 [Yamadazyma tenuis ATCC 10573]EGV62558.1 ATP11-domain-containing protein [Yamadazyma tenuis ATCC 10573]EGV62559.1 hypothetical protein CANTEDRAFT_115019 [Yamadazyma tenuis ATCC 10573]WEJ92774.1 hypothetical protein PSN45_000230 [Yamadazyma tenuis]